MRVIRAVVCLSVWGVATIAFGAENTFGTTATSYMSVGPDEFRGTTSSVSPWVLEYKLYVSSGNWYSFIHLPAGAVLTSVEWDYCDADGGNRPDFGVLRLDRTGNETGFAVLFGEPLPAGCRTVTQDLTADNFTILNRDYRFFLYFTPSEAVEFAGAVVGYKLQVSPAPPTATFGDVPMSDFGFQYIEALVAAGITGGCGGGGFCPDSPVTRRQMAIFMAKALGLQWP